MSEVEAMATEEIKRYKRPAYKGYVDSMDKLYYQMLRRWVKKELKKTRAFLQINTLVFVVALISVFHSHFQLDKQ